MFQAATIPGDNLMRMVNAYINAVKNNYFQFSGRMHRAEFWWFALMNALILFAMYIVTLLPSLKIVGSFILIIYYLAIFLPMIGAQVRRLHDIGMSGWWILILFVPFIGGIVIFIMEVLPSKPSGEKYGPYHDSV